MIRNRPTVFLSHSKVDKEIIRQIADDLRSCRIDSWYDEWEIPAGTSFLREIFDKGIPNCDSFFVYLTENSINSYWVNKEMDAFFIEQSRKKNVAVITFVDSDDIRDKLSPDLAALNSPVINKDNYKEAIIKLVARVYESKIENILATKLLEEENNKLRLEKEIESLQKQVLSLENSGNQSLEQLFLKLSGQMHFVEDEKVGSLDVFKVTVASLASGCNDYTIRRLITNNLLMPLFDGSDMETFKYFPFADLISPLIINSLIDVDRMTDQRDRIYYLSELGKRFAVYMETK